MRLQFDKQLQDTGLSVTEPSCSYVLDSNGCWSPKISDPCKRLPPVGNFSLENQLKAGVNLQRVPCAIQAEINSKNNEVNNV